VEYIIGAGAGIVLFLFLSFRKPTTNDLSQLIIKHKKQEQAVNSKGKTLF
jgi:hypothetical protein